MDNKRKGAPAASPDGDARAAKRQRQSINDGGDVETPETPETTTEVGLRFVETLRNAKDKTGRPIATKFLYLPSPTVVPKYYQQIRLPLAIDTLEAKLQRGEYPNVSALESDVKRMIINAKTFNDRRSSVYEDAERVRKTASNFMVKHNPAYRDPNYSCVPTPLPDEPEVEVDETPEEPPPPPTPTSGRPRRAAAPHTPAPPPTPPRPKRSGRRESAVKTEPAADETGFAGKTFQEAQEKIMSDIIDYQEEGSDLKIFTPFVTLPPRSLADYYAVIKNPVSLKSVLKRVRGVHGRNAPTGVSDFKSWDAFANEASYIWRNAREYNEDGSEIFNLAGELEDHFNERLVEAKASVDEPAHPTLKLKMSAPQKTGLKLRLGGSGQKASPAPQSAPDTPVARSSGTPGVIVDNRALERQQQHVQAGINGQQAASNGKLKLYISSQPTVKGGFPVDPSLTSYATAQSAATAPPSTHLSHLHYPRVYTSPDNLPSSSGPQRTSRDQKSARFSPYGRKRSFSPWRPILPAVPTTAAETGPSTPFRNQSSPRLSSSFGPWRTTSSRKSVRFSPYVDVRETTPECSPMRKVPEKRRSQARGSTSDASPPATAGAVPNGIKREASAQVPRPSTPGVSAPAVRPPIAAAPANPPQPSPANASMPPPAGIAPRVASGSPHPQPSTHQQYNSVLNSGLEHKYRPEGKTEADSILPLLTISSHPALQLPTPLRLRIRAARKLATQSVTATLAARHHTLQITPDLPAALADGSRPYRLFATLNGQRLHPMPSAPTGAGSKQQPVFECRLAPAAVNRLEVEVVAGPAPAHPGVGTRTAGAGMKVAQELVEWEKDVVFLHLMRP